MAVVSVPLLDEIVAHKRAEVAHRRAHVPSPASDPQDRPRGLVRALTSGRAHPIAVIAEIKRKSPSAGWIRPGDDFDPASIACAYADAGASAISCLTDEKYFGGSASYIQRIRAQVSLPVLRKDFLIDPWQIDESRAIGADGVLLIAECLDDDALNTLAGRAIDLDLDILFEAHDRENLARIVAASAKIPDDRYLIGINNRDLRTMTTDLRHAIDLSGLLASPERVVAESGIRTAQDLRLLQEAGLTIVLVGEHLMRQPDPGRALAGLLRAV